MDEGVARHYERIEPLVAAGRLKPVPLWQLPANFRRDDERLGRPQTPPGGTPRLRISPSQLVR